MHSAELIDRAQIKAEEKEQWLWEWMQYPRNHIAEELKQKAVICDHEWTTHWFQHQARFQVYTQGSTVLWHERTPPSDTEENSLAPKRSEWKKRKKQAVQYLSNEPDVKHVQQYVTGSRRLCHSCLMLWSQMWPKLQNRSPQLGLVRDLDSQAEDNVTLASVWWEAQRKG